ncbi:RNase P modulator RnpM [Alteribacillus iranensis]|uniref:YlxR domain-containing protein n=1 Tax=Alteribacillus iranensis TaxID=930128 RepID=A0A1I2A3B2_9BACI|nr:YlxR family protein [Alteribacillus iranensis]SFE38286.1 hypothetical protein SAMN05192532_101627 [Alteribacillus iranensis]
MKRKKPLRKCVVTGEVKEKRELIRVVRDPDGFVFVDHTGKKNGRGAYLTDEEDCFQEAKRKDVLSRHLNVKISSDDYDRLIQERKEK